MALSHSSENDYDGDESAMPVKKKWSQGMAGKGWGVVMIEVIRLFHAGSRVFSFSPFF